ncbi:MAG: cyclic pyranopterin monophosphate synthase MoaC [Anaerolineales bacterium]|nr:cyclic pyranopterin monophosphate synthase MoaC [Anaerolineales bacterium]MDW8447398.1 cyclic pyranopterin monophosphate synthase MoaC [Anaerolineales bacterium]
MEQKLSHFDSQGKARMVDVGDKEVTERWAVARGEVLMRPETLEAIRAGVTRKGDLLNVARIAGVLGAKKTSELIPLCHPLSLDFVEVDVWVDEELPGVQIQARVRTSGKTGVEMEALTAVSVAALTVYDMVKSVEKTMRIQNIRLVEKHGGRSGDIINE